MAAFCAITRRSRSALVEHRHATTSLFATIAEYEVFLKDLDRDVAVVDHGAAHPLHAPSCGESATDAAVCVIAAVPEPRRVRLDLRTRRGLPRPARAHLSRARLRATDRVAVLRRAAHGCRSGEAGRSARVYGHRAPGTGTAEEHERLLAPCEAGALPCWRIVENDQCIGFQHLRVDVDRGGEDPPDNDVVEAQCVSL